MAEDKVTEENIEGQGVPVCKKCGNAMVVEEGELMCPHCQGEIDFLGEENE